jgi:hypothetical protein
VLSDDDRAWILGRTCRTWLGRPAPEKPAPPAALQPRVEQPGFGN